MPDWLVAILVPAPLAAVAIARLRRTSLAARLSDHPNERSLHSRPTPRLGGVAMLAVALPLAAWLSDPQVRPLLAIAAGLGLLSLADDLRSLAVGVRLAAHALAAGLGVIVLGEAHGPIGLAGALALVVAIAWMTNLYNFMDGADGLAGGMAAIGYGGYAIAAWLAGASGLALASATIASAALGFLAFNLPPAKVFMGDAGAIPLGFLAGAFGAQGAWTGAWPAWFPLLVFSPFIVDASVTLLRRLAKGEPIWRAHRSHYYQRLVLGGWSPRRLAAAAYALMLGAVATALAARGAEHLLQCGILASWFAGYIAIFLLIERRGRANASS